MLADGPDAQAKPRPEKHELGKDQQDQGDIDHQVLLEEDLADERDAAQQWDRDIRNRVTARDGADVGNAIKAIDRKTGKTRTKIINGKTRTIRTDWKPN